MNVSHWTQRLGLLSAMAVIVLAQSAVAATVAYYRFEDSPGFTNNSASATHNLVPDAGATQATLPGSGRGGDFSDPIPQTSASNDKAADFNGSAGMDSGTGDGNLITTGAFTLEAFFHADSWSGTRAVAAQWDHTTGNRSWILRFAGGALNLFISQDGSGNESKAPGFTLVTGKDYFVAITFTNGAADFYVRNLTDGGIQKKSATFTSHTSVFATDQITIGEQFGAVFFDGLIDEVRISDTALDPADFLVPVVTATEVYYRFEDSPGFTNDSGSLGIPLVDVHGGTVQYALPGSGIGSDFDDPVRRTGAANSEAVDYVAAADHVSTENSGYIIFDGDFTIEAFFNADNTASRNVIAGSWETTGNNRCLMFSVEGGQMSLFLSDDGLGFESDVSTTLPVSAGDDYFAAVTYDESGGTITMYLQNLTDGGALLSQSFAHGITDLYVEDYLSSGAVNGTQNGFEGVIDEIRVSSSVLPVSKMLISEGLVSHWTGDSTPNDTVSTNHGALVDGATYASGKLGQAFSLDGSGDYVNIVENDASLDVDAYYTKSVWFNPDSVTPGGGNAHAIFLQGIDSVQGGNNYIRISDGSKLSYGVRTSGTITGPTTLSIGTWYHGVLSYDGTTIRLYLDGAEEVNGTTTIDMTADSRVALGAWINPADGNPNGCCYYDGLIDDAALWDVPLTADEVKCLFDVGDSAALVYTAKDFEDLREVHAAGSGSINVGGIVWTYSATLSDAAGLSGSHPSYTLVFDDSPSAGSRTGFTGFSDNPAIVTEDASGVGATSANLNGTLISTGAAPASVYVYYGTSDETTNASSWANCELVQANAPTGSISYAANGLTTALTYFYRYFASNSVGEAWANSSKSFKTTGLVSHWTADNTPNDNVGSNDGTFEGGITYDPSGKIGQAFSHDGADGRMDVADDTTLDVGTTFTKHIWFNTDVISGTQGMFLQGYDNSSGKNNYMNVSGSGNLAYGIHTHGTVSGSTVVSAGTWYHGVVTYDAATLTIYLDGAFETSDTPTIVMNTDSRIIIGRWERVTVPGGCCPFDGLLDDAALWNLALTADEVKCLYDVGDSGDLGYTAKDFDDLRTVHNAGSGSVTIGGLLWTYSGTLSASAGLSGSTPTFTLVFDDGPGAGSRTGFTSASLGIDDTTVIKFE